MGEHRCVGSYMCDVFFLGTALRIPSHIVSIMPGIGISAAGSRLDRSCESEGIRLTIESALRVACGKSDARATGRKAARNEREGAADIAAIVKEMSVMVLVTVGVPYVRFLPASQYLMLQYVPRSELLLGRGD